MEFGNGISFGLGQDFLEDGGAERPLKSYQALIGKNSPIDIERVGRNLSGDVINVLGTTSSIGDKVVGSGGRWSTEKRDDAIINNTACLGVEQAGESGTIRLDGSNRRGCDLFQQRFGVGAGDPMLYPKGALV